MRSITFSETFTIQGVGNGAETQESNVKPESTTAKQKRKKRPRTARINNRIAPITDQRQCKSAKDPFDSEGSESPDPLEPWSTKKITNMNKILAWENSQDSF